MRSEWPCRRRCSDGAISVWAQSSPIRYVYDDLGRLTAVIDQNGDAATYHYDAVGNLTGITRTSAGSVAIFGFTPSGAPIGSSVTLSGVGFSATPGQNTVSFNGTTASVTSASATSLVATVPSGATSGTISVTSPTGSATSAAPFTVTSLNVPTITGFTPAAGVADTSVTITGTNFDPVPSLDKTRFNGGLAGPTSVTSTTLNVLVPRTRGSGRISVQTPAGMAVSASDFIIPPLPYTPADVATSGRIPFGTGTTVTVSTANKIGLMLFDGMPGQRVSLRGTNGLANQVLGCDLWVSILRPDSSVLGPATCMEFSGFIDVATLTVPDTYTIHVDPASTATGSVTLTLYDVPADVTGTITPGGSSVTVSTTIAGQNGALPFSGTAGQRVSLHGTNTLSGQVLGCDLHVSMVNPDGTVLAVPTCMEASGFIDVKTLGATGTHKIVVDPVATASGAVTLTLYDVPPDVTGTITPGGSPVTVSTTTPGQNATLTFAGTSGQRVSLRGTNGMVGQIAFVCDVSVSILKPDASVLAPPSCMETSGFIDALTLPSTGTYTIVTNPASAAVGSLTLTLYDLPADLTGTITPGGSPVTVSTTTPGQNATLTFAGTAGQRVSLRGTNGMVGQIAFVCDVSVSILKPDASVLAPPSCMETSGFIDALTLASTGTYTIVIDPASVAAGSLTLTLYDLPADVMGTITPGGSPVTVSTTTPGQNATLTFVGTAGQRVSLRGTNGMVGQIAFVCDVSVSMLKPDGSLLAAATCMEGSGFIDVKTLAATGTYTIRVDPGSTATGDLTLTLYDVPADTAGTITIGGSVVSVPLSTPGQNGTLSFSGTSGQQVTVRLTNNTFGTTTVRLLKPDGSQLTVALSLMASFNLSMQTLPTTGTYTIVVDPSDANTGGISVSVTNP